MHIETLVVGSFESNCYILYKREGGSCIVIDPGAEAEKIVSRLGELRLKPETIVLTHGHPDHVAAASELKAATGARVLMHRDDLNLINDKALAFMLGMPVEAELEVDEFVEDGQVISAAGITLNVMHTPGHSRGSICLHNDDVVFSGDLLFCGGIGRYDLPGGSDKKITQSLGKLVIMPSETKIYPGHGPDTTIEAERRSNFYITNLFK